MNASQFASPTLVKADGSVETLERMPLTHDPNGSAYNQDWLQTFLFAHLRCLPNREIDPSYKELIPVCREMGTDLGAPLGGHNTAT